MVIGGSRKETMKILLDLIARTSYNIYRIKQIGTYLNFIKAVRMIKNSSFVVGQFRVHNSGSFWTIYLISVFAINSFERLNSLTSGFFINRA